MDVEGHSRSPKTVRLTMDRKAFERADKEDNWHEIEVTFNWSDGSSRRYHLEALSFSAKEEPQMQTMQPLSHSYQAHASGPRSEKDDEYVVKLPNLNGRSKESLESYFRETVSPAFQQEYDLLDRFPSGQPSVLPILYHDSRPEHEHCHPVVTIESSKPGFTVPAVVRKKVPGLSLKQWTEKCRSSDGERFNGLPDTEEWFKIALLLFKSLLEMHTERATHGFLSPSNIIVHAKELTPDRATFINAAEIHRVVYMLTKLVDADAKRLPVRRWYDPLENVYRFKASEGKTVRFELNEGSDYYTATDIFSLGVTLAYLATGEENLISPFDFVAEWPGNPGWQIIHGAETRRTYHVMKAKLLDALLKSYAKRAGASYDGVDAYEDSVRRAEVILQCVRSRADRRAVSVSHASAVLSLFRPAAAGKSINGEGNGSAEAIGKKLVEIALSRKPGQIEALTQQVLLSLASRDLKYRGEAGGNAVADSHYFPRAIQRLLHLRIKSLCERFSSLVGEQFFDSDAEGGESYKSVPSIRVVGSRSTLVDSMLVSLASLEDDAECIALTSSAIWSDENFGPTSRLASMLQLLRIRGVKVTWIVALSAADLLKPHVQRILAFRAYDDQRMDELYRERKSAELPDEKPLRKKQRDEKQQDKKQDKKLPADAFFYACLPPADYEKLLREKRTFIGVLAKANAKSGGKSKKADAAEEEAYDRPLELHIAPDLNSRGGRLVALTYWVRPIRGRRLIEAFEKYKTMARPCKTFERIV
jgi:serine/threonine protein kinase